METANEIGQKNGQEIDHRVEPKIGYKVEINEAVEKIKAHKIVAIPTETVYGLAGLATSQVAIDKIYWAKNRPGDNPLICHFESFESMLDYCIDTPDYLDCFGKSFCPGPVSFLLQIPSSSPLLPATRGLKTAVCRVPNHPIALKIIDLVGAPLAMPSANTSGKISPTTAKMVEQDIELISKIDGVVDGGQTSMGLESSIIDCRNENKVVILRNGLIGKKEIEKVLAENGYGRVEVQIGTTFGAGKQKMTTPGAKYKHYAPNKKVYFEPDIKKFASIKIEPKTSKILVAVLAVDEDIEKIKEVLEVGAEIKTELKTGLDFVFISLGCLDDLELVAKNLYLNVSKIDGKNGDNKEVEYGILVKKYFGESSAGLAISEKLEKMVEPGQIPIR